MSYEGLDTMTDLEVMDLYIEKCTAFVNPRLLGEVTRRGCYSYINYLPGSIKESKAVLRCRLAKDGKYFNDPEIDEIAGKIERVIHLKKELDKLNLADVHKSIPVLKTILELSKEISDYYA